MVTFTQEEIKKVFTYLNEQPYRFSAPLFELFYTKMKEDTPKQVLENQTEVKAPKSVAKTKS